MGFSIWTAKATPEILAKTEEQSKQFESNPEKIFADLVNIKPQAIDLAQNALDVMEGTDSPRMEEIKTSAEAVLKELLLMILTYEKLLEKTPAAAVCDEKYGNTVMMYSLIEDLRRHLKGRLYSLKIGI